MLWQLKANRSLCLPYRLFCSLPLQKTVTHILTDVAKVVRVNLVHRAREDLVGAVHNALHERAEEDGDDGLLDLMVVSVGVYPLVASRSFFLIPMTTHSVLCIQDRSRLNERLSLQDQCKALTDALRKLAY